MVNGWLINFAKSTYLAIKGQEYEEIDKIKDHYLFNEGKGKVAIEALHCAVELGDQGIFERLIKAGCTIGLNERGMTLAHTAARFGQTKMLEYLIKGEYFGVNVQDQSKFTPLTVACNQYTLIAHVELKDYEPVIEYLVKHGGEFGAGYDKLYTSKSENPRMREIAEFIDGLSVNTENNIVGSGSNNSELPGDSLDVVGGGHY